MKLKASGVIEPDFKIKDSKKKKKDISDDGDISTLNRKNDSTITIEKKKKSKKKKKKSSKALNSLKSGKGTNMLMKKITMINKKLSESSLDSREEPPLEKKLSALSEELTNKQNQRFFKRDPLPLKKGGPVVSSDPEEEEDETLSVESSDDEGFKSRERIYLDYQILYARNVRSC